jgi:hypothetical protein
MKKICIVVGDDGSLMVGIEPPEGEEMGEGMEMEEDTSYLKPAESPEAAMEMAMQLIQGDAQPSEGQAMEQMQAGYAKARPGSGMNPAKVLGG